MRYVIGANPDSGSRVFIEVSGNTVGTITLPSSEIGDPAAEQEVDELMHYANLVGRDWKQLKGYLFTYRVPIWDESGENVGSQF